MAKSRSGGRPIAGRARESSAHLVATTFSATIPLMRSLLRWRRSLRVADPKEVVGQGLDAAVTGIGDLAPSEHAQPRMTDAGTIGDLSEIQTLR